MTGCASDFGEERLALLDRRQLVRIGWHAPARCAQCRLENRYGRDVSPGQLVCNTVLIKVLPSAFKVVEPFLRLHAMVVVHGPNGKITKRNRHTGLMKGLDNQISINALHGIGHHCAIGPGSEVAKVDPLGIQRHGHRLTGCRSLLNRRIPDGMQLHRHLPCQHLDGPRTKHP